LLFTRHGIKAFLLLTFVFALVGCSSNDQNDDQKVLYIGGIPDQNLSVLEERFGAVAEHLSEELGISVEYVPVTEYASLVTAFRNGDVHLAWFGGLTGLQAIAFTPGSKSIVQRPRDQEFTSVFIAHSSLEAESLGDLEGSTFTFGSINSTSGHLMPRSFLLQAGIDPETNFSGVPNFSGSHDLTWKLVESGSFQAGALNSAVWERAVSQGSVDPESVRVIHETPSYVDYQWVAHADIDEVFGEGSLDQVTDSILSIAGDTDRENRILELFETESFVRVQPNSYDDLEEIARSLDMLQ